MNKSLIYMKSFGKNVVFNIKCYIGKKNCEQGGKRKEKIISQFFTY